jgi:hypothetical protein
VNGVLHSLDGEEIEAPSAPRTISDMGFERRLWFPLQYKTTTYQSAHLALSIFSDFGWISPFPATDPEARPTQLPVMASRVSSLAR